MPNNRAPQSPALAPPRLKMPTLSRNAYLLLTIQAVNSLALTGVGALLNPYLRNLGMSAAFVGLYFGTTAVVQAVASFSGGFLADSFGRRRIWFAGKMLQILAYLWLASGVTGSAVLLAAVLAGMSQMAVGAVTAMQADASESAWRATFFAVIQTANSLTAAIAPLAGGLLADAYGARWAFAAVLPLLALVAGMITRLEEKPRSAVQAVVSSAPAGSIGSRRLGLLGSVKGRLGELAHGIAHGPFPRTARLFLGHSVLNGISNGAISITLPMLLRDRLGMGYTGIGGIQTALSLGAAMTMIIGARLADQHGRRRILLVSMTCGSVLVCTVPFLTTATSFYLMLFAIGLTANAANGAFGATSMEAVHDQARASYGGVMTGLNAGGMAVGNVLAGLAYGFNQLLPMYGVMVLFATTTLLMFLFLEETGGGAAKREEPKASVAAAASGE